MKKEDPYARLCQAWNELADDRFRRLSPYRGRSPGYARDAVMELLGEHIRQWMTAKRKQINKNRAKVGLRSLD